VSRPPSRAGHAGAGGSRPAPGAGRPAPRDGGQRARALEILLAVEGGRFASELLAPGDGRFVRELVLGVLRRTLTLDSVIGSFGARERRDLDPDVRGALRLGLYQVLFMDGVPPHAAVSESVATLPARSRGYANAVLRAVLRESHKVPEGEDRGGASPTKRLHRPGRAVIFFSRAVFPDPTRDRTGWLAAVHSHPRLLVERWVARLGEDAAVARMEAGNQPAPLVLRPRHGRITAAELVDLLALQRIAADVLPRPDSPGADAVLVRAGQDDVFACSAFRDGLFVAQDLSQMDAAEILEPRAGEVVWDLCAAPGGKASQLAERLGGEGGGRVVATDSSEERLLRLQQTVARLRLGNVECAVHDALSGAPPPGRPPHGFDAVLVDAPCSNTAVLARRPEARWRLRPDTFTELAALQRRLLGAARAHLRPGGRLVYSVCSFEPEEGEAHGLRPTRSPFVWTEGA